MDDPKTEKPMSAANTCERCKWWDWSKDVRERDTVGRRYWWSICNSRAVRARTSVCGDWMRQDFGCRFWERKPSEQAGKEEK